jgi:colanic acid/amylovoran biosynthesis protein
VQNPSYKACLLGASLSTGNRGVSALCASTVRLLTEAKPNTEMSLMIGSRNAEPLTLLVDNTPRRINIVNNRLSPKAKRSEHLAWIVLMALLYRALPIKSLRQKIINSTPWIKAAVESDFVGEIRGGDSFSDIYGLRRFFTGTIPILTVIWVRGNAILLPQTYGPFKGSLAKMLARYVLERASVILSRDQDSIKVVEQLTHGRRTAQFCPDVAFVLESIKPADTHIEPSLPEVGRDDFHGVPNSGCLIGINVNGLVYNGGYTRANMFGLKLDYRAYLAELLRTLLTDANNHILLVPHTFAPDGSPESDPAASRELMNSLPIDLKSRVHIVNYMFNQNEIKGVIGLCDFFIGTRMHACIAAISQCIPTAAVAYSKKFAGVFDSVGVGDCVIDARTVSNEDALRRTLEIFNQRDQFAKTLPPRIGSARAILRKTFTEITT